MKKLKGYDCTCTTRTNIHVRVALAPPRVRRCKLDRRRTPTNQRAPAAPRAAHRARDYQPVRPTARQSRHNKERAHTPARYAAQRWCPCRRHGCRRELVRRSTATPPRYATAALHRIRCLCSPCTEPAFSITQLRNARAPLRTDCRSIATRAPEP